MTPDAYYDERPDDGPSGGSAGGGSAATTRQQPVSGTAERTDTITVARGGGGAGTLPSYHPYYGAEVEAQGLLPPLLTTPLTPPSLQPHY